MKVPIKGVKTKEMKKAIDKKLDEAGFTACEVDTTLKLLVVPDIYISEMDEIAMALAEVGDFEVNFL